jgi:ligand-binding sensor domain-containing protein/signal transduction histidine kinase
MFVTVDQRKAPADLRRARVERPDEAAWPRVLPPPTVAFGLELGPGRRAWTRLQGAFIGAPVPARRPKPAWLGLLCLVVFWAFGFVDRAQALDAATNLVVDVWQMDAGLPNNSVTSLLQTKDRYLWIGTSNGLARFDGTHFTTYRSVDNPGLRSNRILCLYEDAGEALWIGTHDGGLMRMRHGQLSPFTTVEGLSSDTVLSITGDADGVLWVGTSFGLNRRLNGQFSTYFKNDGLPDDQVLSLAAAFDSSIIVGTAKGLARIKRGSLGPKVLNDPALAGLQAKCLFESSGGNLYVGGDSGVVRLRKSESGRYAVERLARSDVDCLIERAGGEVWCGTAKGDLLRIVPDTEPTSAETVWHCSSGVLALCEDVEGNLWVGTGQEGLFRLKQRELRLIPFPQLSAVNPTPCCFQTPDGKLRFLTADKTIYGCEDGQMTPLAKLPLSEEVVVQSVFMAPGGELWIGTRSDGLLKYQGGEITRLTQRDELSDNSIQSLCPDDEGGIWVGTRNGGLNYVKERQVLRFNTPWGFNGNYAAVIKRDREKRVWIGTTGDGLFAFSGDHFTSFTDPNGLPSGQIQSLLADDDGVLWVGTARGLCRVKDGLVTSLAGRGGLGTDAILQLRSDGQSNLWVGTTSGIFRLRKDELAALAEGTASFVNAVPYGKEDGLPVIQCVADIGFQAESSGACGVWFLTTKGLVVVEPGSLHLNSTPPAIVFEQAKLENEIVPLDGLLQVPPGKERVQFQYNALSLTAPGKIKFRYRLDRYDRDWSEPSSSRTALYPRIPPGTYTFRVIACNNDGVWNETGAAAEIISIAFWWETKTFRILMAVLAAGTAAALYRLKKARHRELERLRVRIAGDLHDEIGSSLWSIALLSRMLSKHGSLGTQEREDLDEIHRIAVQTSNSIRDIIWLINPAFDTIQDLLLRTQDFARTILRGVEYRVVCEGTTPSRKLSPDMKQNLFLLFKEALTNIARHAGATVVEVRVEETGRGWRLAISDDGVGFQPGALASGNGLRNLQARAQKMGGELEIRSRPGKGTTLLFSTERL